MPAAGAGALTVIVPVAVAHVGCAVTLAVGAGGVAGCAFTVTLVTADIHPLALCAINVCGPGATAVYPPAGYGAYGAPSRLKVKPAVTEVIVIVPVATVQVGSVTVAVGEGGVGGCGSITTSADGGEMHPAALVTVKLYVPVARPLIVVVVPVPVIAPGLIVQVPDAGRLFNTTDPVATVQVGCVMMPTVGAAGVAGCGSITTSADGGEVHPAALVTVKL